jgi:hypothetical protein
MELDRQDAGESQAQSQGLFSTEKRLKSAARMTYEAEVKFLKETNGDLENVRLKLGLSRRKMCQLLLVDPSAWTRWTAEGGEAPPHIYRALDWYLAGMEKDPEYRRLAKRFSEWLNVEKDHEGRLASLEALLTASSQSNVPVERPRPKWELLLVPLLAFVAGALLTFFLAKF